MSKLILIILFTMIMIFTNTYAEMTVPRVVIQEVYEYPGSYPDNVLYPEEGSIKFRTWIKSRPEYVLTDEHLHSSADLHGGFFTVRFNLGNFPGLTGAPVDWSWGESLVIVVTHTPTGRIGRTEFEIPSGSSTIVRRNEEAIFLQEQTEKNNELEKSEQKGAE